MSIRFQYFLYGFAFGFCFPVFAVILQIIIADLDFSFKSIQTAHQQNMLIYMIDTAPLFLGLFALLGGISKQKAVTIVNDFKLLANELKNSNNQLNMSSSRIFKQLNYSSQYIESHTSALIAGNDELHDINANCESKAVSLNQNAENLIDSTIHLVEVHKKLKLFNEKIHNELNDFAVLNKDLNTHFKGIDSIGTEIKILALNSSIEAHKLGEKGKGFTVISRQIRSLAENVDKLNQKTQTIAHNISEEITRLTESVENQKTELQSTSILISKIEENTASSKQSLEDINQSINDSLKVQFLQKEEFAEIKQELSTTNGEREEVISALETLINSNNRLINKISEL